jgi:hypothetical protein
MRGHGCGTTPVSQQERRFRTAELRRIEAQGIELSSNARFCIKNEWKFDMVAIYIMGMSMNVT